MSDRGTLFSLVIEGLNGPIRCKAGWKELLYGGPMDLMGAIELGDETTDSRA